MKRRNAAGRVVICCRVARECLFSNRRVEATSSVLNDRGCADRRVLVAGGVAKERLIPEGRIDISNGIVEKRLESVGSVVETDTISCKCVNSTRRLRASS